MKSGKLRAKALSWFNSNSKTLHYYQLGKSPNGRNTVAKVRVGNLSHKLARKGALAVEHSNQRGESHFYLLTANFAAWPMQRRGTK